jgi:hypothetical protein
MTSLKKELRTLAWPAAAIAAVIVVPMVWASTFEPTKVLRHPLSAGLSAYLSSAGCLLGSALLAALPFGAEFQHRTMVLLMAQPLSRRRIWLTKHAALAGALIVVGLAGYFVTGPLPSRDGYPIALAGFLLIMVCSGGLWTLVAGSTIGGAAFSLAGLAIVELTSSFIASRVTGLEIDQFTAHPVLTVMRVACAALTAWLGWRMFARYELKAPGEGGIAVATSLPERLPALRPRPTGAIANLIRKEVRLQQPTLLIATLFTAVWLAAMLFFAMPPARPQVANAAFTVLLVSYYPLAILVCGAISIGEDTALGIRPWHLTLPVTSFTQWSVKLGVTLVVGALAIAVPFVLAALTPTSVALAAGEIQMPSASRTALAAGSLIVISFWSATMLGHTVRAAVAVVAFVPVLWLAGVLASLIGQRCGLGGDLMTYLMVANQWSPEAFLPSRASMPRMFEVGVFAFGAVLVGLALRHSLAAFRSTQVGRRMVIRSGLQLVAVTMLFSFVPSAYFTAAASRYQSQPVRELEAALQHISAASLAATGRVSESVEMRELEATGLLSEDARRWLAGSRVSQMSRGFTSQSGEFVQHVFATVDLPNGRVFQMLYRSPPASTR